MFHLAQGMFYGLMLSLMCAAQKQNALQNMWWSQKTVSWSPLLWSKTNKPKRKERKKTNLRRLLLTSSLRPFPNRQLIQLGIDPNFVSLYKCQACTVFLDFKNRCFSSVKLSNYFRRFSFYWAQLIGFITIGKLKCFLLLV